MSDLLLAIDTAGEQCAACVYDTDADRILASAAPVIGRGHAERLMGVVADVLGEAAVAYGDLSRLAVTVGPGSFTGLRVGVAAVRGLSLALAIPAVGVTTLEALAEPYLRQGAAVLSVLDAKRGEVYAALFDANGAVLAGPAALAPSDLPRLLAILPAAVPLLIAGSGARIAAAALPGAGAVIASEKSVADIAAVARIAASRQAGAPPKPLYLRGADAKPQSPAAVLRGTAFSTSQPRGF